MSFFKKLWWALLINCRYCGCGQTRREETPFEERPHWRIFCKRCGKRRSDLDGFTDR